MANYGIATLLEYHDVGYEFPQDKIPLHLTHVDSFRVDLEASELAAKLSESLIDQSAFVVKAAKDKLYGPHDDILVTEIEFNSNLSQLHALIMKMLRDNNAILKNPQFHNDGYSPHISVYNGRRVKPGDEILVDNLVIASKTSDAENAITRILAKFCF